MGLVIAIVIIVLLALLALTTTIRRRDTGAATGGLSRETRRRDRSMDVPPDVAQPQVWLENARDRERAQAVLDALEEERTRTGTVFCRKCKEENPANFELCWRCGEGRA